VLKRFSFVGLILLAGCAAADYRLVSSQNAIDGSASERLEGNLLSGSKPWQQIELNLERITQAERHPEYYFVLEYENRSVMYKERSLSIGDDESLVLIIDGARYRFRAIGGGSVKGVREEFETETARYLVSVDLLQLLARSSIVEVLVHGKTNLTEKYFNQFNFEYLSQFLLKFGTS
jgi:hypothetical protein